MSALSQLSTKKLLAMRATGPDLDPGSHNDVEKALRAQGVEPPPIPEEPVYIDEAPLGDSAAAKWGRDILMLLLIFVAVGLGRAVARTWGAIIAFLAAMAIVHVIRQRRDAVKLTDLDDDASFDKAARALCMDEVMQAAAQGKLRRLQDLVNYGAQIDRHSSDGADCLMYAARNGHADCVQFLLERGANPEQRTPAGNTARKLAERHGHTAVIQMLDQRAPVAAA